MLHRAMDKPTPNCPTAPVRNLPSRRFVVASGLSSLALASCQTSDFSSIDPKGDDAVTILGFRPHDKVSGDYPIQIRLAGVDPTTLALPAMFTGDWMSNQLYMTGGPGRPYSRDKAKAGTYVLAYVNITDVRPMLRYRYYEFLFQDPSERETAKQKNFRVDTMPGKINYLGDLVYRIVPSTKKEKLKFAITSIGTTFVSASSTFPDLNKLGMPYVENLMRPVT